MKANETAQQELLVLGTLDLEIGRTKRVVSNLMAGAQHEEIRSRLREAAVALIDARNAFDDASLELERAEADLKVVEARIVKDNAQLKSTSIPSVATGIQHELATLARRKSELEDIEIAILEKREVLTAEFEAVQKRKAEIEAELAASESVTQQEVMKLQSGLALQAQDRNQLIGRLPADLVAAYERKLDRGTGVGRLSGRECSACHIGLDAVAYSAISALPKDELAECPECDAFLVRA
ncbi:MAG: hypothetical protein KGL77_01250 [Actinomycetales bacterium]|nr:hypothetical protein [Actinomycetales bacterium]